MSSAYYLRPVTLAEYPVITEHVTRRPGERLLPGETGPRVNCRRFAFRIRTMVHLLSANRA